MLRTFAAKLIMTISIPRIVGAALTLMISVAPLTPAHGQAVATAIAGDTGIKAADPSVIRTNLGFVAVESRGGRALLVRIAPSLEGLAEAQPKRVWSDRDRLGEVWAPEIVHSEGRYEIIFAAGVGSDHRMFSISSAKPDDGYGDATEIMLPDDKWAIDGLPFSYQNERYFVWSGWQGDTDVQQDIFIARLDENGTAVVPRVRIGTPDQAWENIAEEIPSINEGPQPVIDPAGNLHMVYSANGSWGPNYCLAELRLSSNGDPLDAEAWMESNGCLFGANLETLADGATLAEDAKGVGHHSFILAGDTEQAEGTDGRMPFLYHGVPAEEEPPNFWAARKWFIGSYDWVPDVVYGAGESAEAGWSLRFSE